MCSESSNLQIEVPAFLGPGEMKGHRLAMAAQGQVEGLEQRSHDCLGLGKQLLLSSIVT